MKTLTLGVAAMLALFLSMAPALSFADDTVTGTTAKESDTLKKDAETGLKIDADKDKDLGKSDIDKDINKDVGATDDMGKGKMSGDKDTLTKDKLGVDDQKQFKDMGK